MALGMFLNSVFLYLWKPHGEDSFISLSLRVCFPQLTSLFQIICISKALNVFESIAQVD